MAGTPRRRIGQKLDIVHRPSDLKTESSIVIDAQFQAERERHEIIPAPSPENTIVLSRFAFPPGSFSEELSKSKDQHNHSELFWVDVTEAMNQQELVIGDRRVLLSMRLVTALLQDATLETEVVNERGFVNSFVSEKLVNAWLGYKMAYRTTGNGHDRSISSRLFKDDKLVILTLQSDQPTWLNTSTD